MSKKTKENLTCKVVLVGDSGVGKTCIVQRFANDIYEANTESTIASAYTYKMLDYDKENKSISFDIWDTAGQELYRSLAKNFYLNAAIGILVYDISRKDSFESIKDFWYEQLKTSGEKNIIFGIAGNKCDLFNNEQVSEAEVKKFAEKIGAVFRLTSAQSDVGINELFTELGQKYLEEHSLEKKNNDSNDKPKGVALSKDNLKDNNGKEKKNNGCC